MRDIPILIEYRTPSIVEGYSLIDSFKYLLKKLFHFFIDPVKQIYHAGQVRSETHFVTAYILGEQGEMKQVPESELRDINAAMKISMSKQL